MSNKESRRENILVPLENNKTKQNKTKQNKIKEKRKKRKKTCVSQNASMAQAKILSR
jgi:hypothetical protein